MGRGTNEVRRRSGKKRELARGVDQRELRWFGTLGENE